MTGSPLRIANCGLRIGRVARSSVFAWSWRSATTRCIVLVGRHHRFFGVTLGTTRSPIGSRLNVATRKLACAVLVPLYLAGTSIAFAGEVRLFPTAVASGPNVTLGDVATLYGFDAHTAEDLGRLTLRPAPDRAQTETVGIEDVRAALESAGVSLADVTLLGAAECKVAATRAAPKRPNPSQPAPDPARDAPQREAIRPGSRRRMLSSDRQSPAAHETLSDEPPLQPGAADHVNDGTLEAALRDYVDGYAADLGGRVEVRFGVAHRAALALRSPECRFDIRPRGENKLGMVWFDVNVAREGRKPQSVPILAEVTLLKPVVVASRNINHGQQVSGRDVRLEERPFKRLDDAGVAELAAVVGMDARRAIHPGDMLRSRDVRMRPLVQRNQLVTLWSRAGGLIVQKTGRAMDEGTLGDVVQVRPDGAKETVFATVSGPATVSVDERTTQVARR